MALKDNPAERGDPVPLVMRAVANIMLERPQEALKDLANPIVGNQFDAPLWRAWADARMGRWADANEGFRDVDARIPRLPVELQRKVLEEMIRVAIAVGDVAGAVNVMHEFEILGVPQELEPTMSVYNGELAERLGHTQDALQSYQFAAESPDRRAAALGQLREVKLETTIGKLKPDAAIDDLETLTTIWRGDDTEIEALRLLAHLYTKEGRYRDSFHVMRIALTAHPNSELTRSIQDEASETFENIFLAGTGDTLSAIDALALFYDFRDLTPIGRRGDEIIRRLADRLVAVDLLDQAAELLRYQVDNRLQGAARAQVAMRLAVIYLMNHKPDERRNAKATRGDIIGEKASSDCDRTAGPMDMGRHDVALEVANITGPAPMRCVRRAGCTLARGGRDLATIAGVRRPRRRAKRHARRRRLCARRGPARAGALSRALCRQDGRGPRPADLQRDHRAGRRQRRGLPCGRPLGRGGRYAERLPARPARALSGDRRAAGAARHRGARQCGAQDQLRQSRSARHPQHTAAAALDRTASPDQRLRDGTTECRGISKTKRPGVSKGS